MLSANAPMMLRFVTLAATLSLALGDYYYPQMIHLSLTGKGGEMAIDWIDSCPDGSSEVHYGQEPSLKNASVAKGTDHANAHDVRELLLLLLLLRLLLVLTPPLLL